MTDPYSHCWSPMSNRKSYIKTYDSSRGWKKSSKSLHQVVNRGCWCELYKEDMYEDEECFKSVMCIKIPKISSGIAFSLKILKESKWIVCHELDNYSRKGTLGL